MKTAKLFRDALRRKALLREWASVLLAGMVIHFALYSNGLVNPDSLWSYGQYFSGEWEMSLGRFGMPVVDWMRRGMSAPVLCALYAMSLFAATAVLINELFVVEKRWTRYCVSLSIVSSPVIANLISFYYMSVTFGLAFFFAAASVFLVARWEKWWAVGAGAVLLTAALSLYQSGLGVAAALCAMALTRAILKSPDAWGRHGKMLLRMLVYGAAGLILYYVLLKIVLNVCRIQLADYEGIAGFGVKRIVENLLPGVRHAYKDFIGYFLRKTIMVNSFNVRESYIALAAVFAVAVAFRFVRLRKHVPAILAASALMLLVPAACNITVLIATETSIILRTAQGMLMVVPFMVSLIAESSEPLPAVRFGAKFSRGLKAAACGACVLLVLGNASIDNMDALVMKANLDKTVQLANRLCAKIEDNEHYKAGAPLMIAGIPNEGNYPADLLRGTVNFYANKGLMWRSFKGMFGWENAFKYYLGMTMNWCTRQQKDRIIETEAFKTMPCYPEDGSIAVLDDVLVVKISEGGNWVDR